MNQIVEEVIQAYGGDQCVIERFSYGGPMAIYQWRKRGLPKSLLADIHIDTKISIERLKLGVKNDANEAVA